jgi:hypothetical protein
MSPKITVLRIMIRGVLASFLVLGAILTVFWLKEGLSQENTNAALIGLLGTILGFLGASLKDLTGAISSNPSDTTDS